MAEIRALIVDDEPMARRGIRQLLAAYPDFVVVGECRDGREAVRALSTLEPDVVFLDIEMPGLDGMRVIRVHGAERMPITVFVTAHDEFAVHAFEAQALDYLVKPLGETRFAATIERVREHVRVNDAVAMARRLTALLDSQPGGGMPIDDGFSPSPARSATSARSAPSARGILVPSNGGERILDPEEIDWIEARDDVAAIHAKGRRYVVRASLTALEPRLDPAEFVRIHRSTIVRLDRIREWGPRVRGTGIRVLLKDGTELAVSRRRVARLRSLLEPGRPVG